MLVELLDEARGLLLGAIGLQLQQRQLADGLHIALGDSACLEGLTFSSFHLLQGLGIESLLI